MNFISKETGRTVDDSDFLEFSGDLQLEIGVDENLDIIGSSDEKEEEALAEAKLESRLVETALVYYVVTYGAGKGWYKPETSPRTRGILSVLSTDVGIFGAPLREALTNNIELEFLEAAYNYPKNPKTVTNIRATESASAFIEDFKLDFPEDVTAIENYLKHIRYETIRLMRAEVNHERELLHKPPLPFKKRSEYKTVQELNDHLAQLVEAQTSLEAQLAKK